ncbi:MAG: glycosyltransferase family 4 protein [Akkermansia sp.]|nr:glycosyltransferase family 4 protein [Akkermansia sp.]
MIKNQKRLKILVGCYACDPNYGSEPGMGWHFVINIAKYHNVHAIVEKHEFEENLKLYAQKHPEEVKNISFHFIPRVHHKTLRKIWPPSYYWFYRQWQKEAYRYALKLDKKENFDIIHQLTLAGYREPGYLWKLGKPFIWGPIGGLHFTPWRLLLSMGLYGTLYFGFRNIINAYQIRRSYAAKKVAPIASNILVCDPAVHRLIHQHWHTKCITMREVGVDAETAARKTTNRQQDAPIVLCWAGALYPGKALHILLEALALSKRPYILHVLGDGPCLKKWKKKAEKLSIEKDVIFHGRVQHKDVSQIMENSHIFCITSLSEGGTTTVVLEALQIGLPVIALNHCAYSSIITKDCGLKVDITTFRKVVKSYAEHIDFLYDNEEERQRLSVGAVKRSQEFSWSKKSIQLNDIYAKHISI